MYIERIEVPAFRALRDVVLEFGGAYEPPIFPVGSENGGGKSTLLQLLFALLHCSAYEERHTFLQNLLASERDEGEEPERLIARLTLRMDDTRHVLEFISLGDRFLIEHLPEPPKLGFASETQLAALTRMQEQASERRGVLSDLLERTEHMSRDVRVDPEILDLAFKAVPGLRMPRSTSELRAILGKELQALTDGERARESIERLAADAERVRGVLISRDLLQISSYAQSPNKSRARRALVCHGQGLSVERVKILLARAAQAIFLLGPSNQQYLFLGLETRRALLGKSPSRSRPALTAREGRRRPQIEYLEQLDGAENKLEGFYAYDWLSVEPLVLLFRTARDEDFRQAVKTGHYGTFYTDLLREVNGLLYGKTVRPLEDLSGVEFLVKDAQGRDLLLGPEDLSQGELKRLMIYAWLRANNAIDAVVLIDEVETSFHPDWQIGIIRDLQRWAPKNQYLLATHSYELCEALTPRHVRELEPRLRRTTTEGGEEPSPERS